MIALEAEAEKPEKLRMWGLHFGVPGTLACDVDYGLFHAFASANLIVPALTASGSSLWAAGAIGAGVAIPMGGASHWKLDLFGQVLPLHVTSFYTYLGAGIGAGFHYTGRSGLSREVPRPSACSS